MFRCTRWMWLVAFCTFGAAAQDKNADEIRLVPSGSGVSFTGDDIRLGIGVDHDGDIHGEYFHVFGEDENSSWIGELWASDSRGGVKLNYHWLSGADSYEDGIGREDEVRVNKIFAAVDQNQFDDRKVTFGYGREAPRLFWSLYGMAALTDERLLSQSLDLDIVTNTFIDGNGVFTQDTITETVTSIFEHPYDYGVGARLGTWFDNSLVRLRGGLDYERGDFDSDQLTLSMGLEKYFENTPHSLALTAEFLNKSGDFEQDESDDARAMLMYRYSFGERYRPRRETAERRVAVSESDVEPATRTERRPVRNRIEITDEAYFDFDRAAIRDDAASVLAEVIDEVSAKEIVGNIRVVGHTCNIGTDAYNMGLSNRRAQSAVDYLVSRGIDRDKIRAEGRGESQPKYSNATEDTRKLNRRVEIEFVSIEETMESVEVQVADSNAGRIKWVKEPITDPAWMDRAMRNQVAHKRTVDTYRYETTSEKVTQPPAVLINTLPTVADDAATTAQDEAITINVLANDSDPDGPLRVVTVSSPANGMAEVNSDGTVTYTPAAGFFGTDTFTYTAVDSDDAEATATVTVTVTEVPPVVVNDDSAQTPFGVPVTIDVLANDTGENLVITAVGSAAGGTVEVDGTQVRYTPNLTFFGQDQFSYTVADESGQEATGTVTIEVGAPVALVAGDDSASTLQAVPVTIAVLDNDSGETIELVSVDSPANGTAMIAANGSILYTPNVDFVGTDSFSYTIEDVLGDTASATVTVTVEEDPNNTAPIAVDDTATTEKDEAVLIDVLANDSDPDGDPLTVIALDTSATQFGTVEISGNSVLYTPNADWWGSDEFAYTVSDGRGGVATANVLITVNR